MKLKTILLLSCFALADVATCNPVEASVAEISTRMPRIFGDHMVLQRNTDVTIWGWDKPATRIVFMPSWGEKVESVSDENGYWEVAIKTLGAGGPHSLIVQGTDNLQFDDILFGEVWLCSGQSNMEMPVKGFPNQPIVNSQNELLHANKPKIRIFTVARNSSEAPATDIEGKWEICTPESIQDFSAVGYFFGDKLLEHLDVPVGLIGSYWGGTPVEAWIDKNTLETNYPEADLQIRKGKPQPGSLFNGMIHPIIPYTIKGVIWYQGESNRTAPEAYQRLFPAMISDWRLKWALGDFPFYFVQIAPFRYEDCDAVGSALLRESQLKTSESVKNVGMVVSLDHGNSEYIHPFNKRPIGERLAKWALEDLYGYEFIQTNGPVLKNMVIEENQAILSFDHAPNGLIAMNAELGEFEIAASNRIFYPAKAVVNRDGTVTVSAQEVEDPVAVRYAFRNCPEATLFNTEGLPASSFRTDNW